MECGKELVGSLPEVSIHGVWQRASRVMMWSILSLPEVGIHGVWQRASRVMMWSILSLPEVSIHGVWQRASRVMMWSILSLPCRSGPFGAVPVWCVLDYVRDWEGHPLHKLTVLWEEYCVNYCE